MLAKKHASLYIFLALQSTKTKLYNLLGNMMYYAFFYKVGHALLNHLS